MTLGTQCKLPGTKGAQIYGIREDLPWTDRVDANFVLSHLRRRLLDEASDGIFGSCICSDGLGKQRPVPRSRRNADDAAPLSLLDHFGAA